MPGRIAPILDTAREPIAPEEATTAVFYSISNTQRGLAGVSFGHFLIKQVVEDLRHELPGLTTFVTLSPVPAFRPLARCRAEIADEEGLLGPETRAALAALDNPGWHNDAALVEEIGAAASRRRFRLFPRSPRPPAAASPIRSPASISATAPASSSSTCSATPRPRGSNSPTG